MGRSEPVYYLAPHADDVALSCAGSVAADVAAGRPVTLVTAFLSGPDSDVRRAEDQAAAAVLGCAWRCLELPDARDRPEVRGRLGVFSRYGQAHLGITNEVWSRLRQILPAGDGGRPPAIELRAPLAVGGHIDHRIVHEAARALAFDRGPGTTLGYYEDQPYSLVPYSLGRRLAALEARGLEKTQLPGTERAALPFERAAVRDFFLRLPLGQAMLPGWRQLALHVLAGAVVRADLDGQRPGPPPRLRVELRDVTAHAGLRQRAVAAYPTQWPQFAASAEALCARIEAYGRMLGKSPAGGPVFERLWYDEGALD